MNDAKMRVVYAISPERKDRDGKVIYKEGEKFWKEIGTAFTNADDSISVYLDAVPVSGKLQIRDLRPKRDEHMAGGAR